MPQDLNQGRGTYSQTARFVEKIPEDLLPPDTAPGKTLETIGLAAGHYRATCTTWGARLLSFVGPDGVNIVVGPRDIKAILTDTGSMGAVVGRVANRIGQGYLPIPGQGTYQLPCNDGAHHLHGGPLGFDKRFWDVGQVSSRGTEAWVQFTLDSQDGDQGYPGTVEVQVTYTLTAAGDLTVTMESHVTDASTPVNLTHHAYWNLAGGLEGVSCLDTLFYSNARSYLETDARHLPTGRVLSVRETPFDFNVRKPLGAQLPQAASKDHVAGYDVYLTALPETNESRPIIARLKDPKSLRELIVTSNQPGFQMYTGNYLTTPFVPHQAVCVEPSGYVDAVNHAQFPSIVAHPGETVRQETVFSLRCPANHLA